MKYNTLYPCQEVAIGHAVEFIKAAKPGDKQMYAAPTGIGKSVVQLHVQKRLNECMPGAHWIATPRDEIIAGMIDKLGLPKGTDAFPLHISTPTILRNRMLRGELPEFPASLTFDEGHHHNAETYQQLTLLTGYCPSLAYTATPYRGSPASTRQLREFWGDPLWIISYAEAFAEGYIKLPTFTTLPLVDDDVVSINGGEFSIESIEGATMDRLSDLAEHSKQWYNTTGWDKPTIYSLSSKLLCNRLNQELGQRGLPTIVVTAESTPADRELAFDACEKGIVAILQINVVSEGVDLRLRRLVDLAPTMSPVKWMQQIGRIMRPTTDQPEYIATNRNLMRHSYALEGCVPVAAISEATKLWPDSERSNVRAIGLEAIGRFKPATVKLRSGVNCHIYSISTVTGGKVVEYSCVVHPCSDPIWCTKVNTRDAAGNRSWGSWQKCPAPESLTGFASVPPADLTPKQRAWWNRSAAGMGLDEKQEVTRKNFVILPVLTNIGVRL